MNYSSRHPCIFPSIPDSQWYVCLPTVTGGVFLLLSVVVFVLLLSVVVFVLLLSVVVFVLLLSVMFVLLLLVV